MSDALAGKALETVLRHAEIDVRRFDRPQVLWWLRRSYLANTVGQWLRESRLRLVMIMLFGAVLWLLLFGIFFEAFHFLEHRVRIGPDLTAYLFHVFFMTLTIMLVFSAGVIGFHGLFRSPEAAWLLQTPLPDARVFVYKYQAATLLSSWGFLLLASPMMIACGINKFAPWYFYVLFPVSLVVFVTLPAAIGLSGALLLVRTVPRHALRFGLMLIGTVTMAGAIWAYRVVMNTPGMTFTPDWLEALVARMRFCQQPLMPSYWVAEQLLALLAGDLRRYFFFLTVVGANAALAYVVMVQLAAATYRTAYSRAHSFENRRIPRPTSWLDRVVHAGFWFTDRTARLLFLKDLRTFVRDPAQWSQLLVFFGLLALYFVNVRGMRYEQQAMYWRNAISFLNLTVAALILATFTSRFVFPLVSLEGKKLWILGLLPVPRETILWSKFAYSVTISVLASELLVILSDIMLDLAWWMIGLHSATVLILCLGLSGLSVGLGARLPNLRETDPSRIAAGFGGTLNLVLSMVFILVIVAMMAIPCHLYLAGLESGRYGHPTWSLNQFRFWVGVSMTGAAVLGYVVTVVPMRMGIRHFERLEV